MSRLALMLMLMLTLALALALPKAGKRAAALALSLLLAPSVHADIYGYVDDRGVAHFAAEQIDQRYQLFFRGGESFDTSRGLAAPEQPLAARAAPPRLLALFEAAPGYRQLRSHLRQASADHGIDYELLQALIATESGFDSGAISPKGAIGLMQVMPATAQRYGLAGDRKTSLEKKLTDPRTNIRAGTRYLSFLIQLFPGKLELALAAYNAGEGAVQRAGNQIPNYRETQNYVKTVTQLYRLLKPPAAVQAAVGRPPARVRMELPALIGGARGGAAPIGGARGGTAPVGGASWGPAPIGGAVGRGNLPPGEPLASLQDPPPAARE